MKKFPPLLRDSIPSFSPSLALGLKYFFKGPDGLVLDLDAPPYTKEEIAWVCSMRKGLSISRHYVIMLFFSVLSAIFFFTQKEAVYINLKDHLFFISPFEDIFHSFFWYFYEIILFFALGLLIFCFFALVYIFYKDSSYVIKEIKKINFNSFDKYRNFYVFISETFSLAIFLWYIHIVLKCTFVVTSSGIREERLLSTFEFFYFFCVSYTTLGFGDIVPFSYGSRNILLIINVYTIISVVYWYGSISRGPRKKIVRKDTYQHYSDFLIKVEEKEEWIPILKLVLNKMNKGDNAYCPYKEKTGHDCSCLLCSGKNRVRDDVYICFAVDTSLRWKKFLRLGLGLNKKYFKKVYSILTEK